MINLVMRDGHVYRAARDASSVEAWLAELVGYAKTAFEESSAVGLWIEYDDETRGRGFVRFADVERLAEAEEIAF